VFSFRDYLLLVCVCVVFIHFKFVSVLFSFRDYLLLVCVGMNKK
jgi:hypothetical protein